MNQQPPTPTGRQRRKHTSTSVRFVIVGTLTFFVDAGLYNAFVFLGNDGHGLLFSWPLPAKVISILAATAASYLGSKYFTFSDSRAKSTAGQVLLFFSLNLVAIGLQLSCLAFSRYALGQQDVISDNIWGTVVGQAAAMLFRYFSYGKWVFPTESQET